jgi:hypothetical protein
MRLPAHLRDKRFHDWNHVLRGVVEAWELARMLGTEEQLEQQLMEDQDGTVAERVGELGHDCAQRALTLGRLAQLQHAEDTGAPPHLTDTLPSSGG